jgi:putative ABC transport system ATP-binding protein
MTPPPAVRAVDLTRHFRAGDDVVRAVESVTLDIARGTLAALMGPSGSGKTTLLSLVAGLMAPSRGTVATAGVALAGLGPPALAAFRLRHVGIVFQAFHLVEALTVLENVELPLTLAGVRRPASAVRAAALVERLGLAHRAGFRPFALSGGEQQRCAIARALANDPAVIVADEPTGSLDAVAGDGVIALLRELAYEGRTVVVASHDPRLGRVADVVMRLEYGRLVESPRPDTGTS